MCDDCGWEEALNECETIQEMCDEVCNSFSDSVSEKVNSISETIEEREHVTDRQNQALGNMRDAIAKWIHD